MNTQGENLVLHITNLSYLIALVTYGNEGLDNKRSKKYFSRRAVAFNEQVNGIRFSFPCYVVIRGYMLLLRARCPDERQDFLNDLADLGR